MTHLSTRFARNSNRFQSDKPLDDDQLRAIAPSIFATAAHSSRSERYTFIPTSNVLNGLRAEGFQPFMVAQSRSRIEGKAEFTKHLLRLRRPVDGTIDQRSELPEIILVGSHDGTSSYQMLAGLLRLACMNGMIVSSGTVDEIRVHHKGDIVGRVIEGAYSVVNEFDKVRESADAMKQITLSTGEQTAFAHAALVAKYGEPKTGAFPITESQILQPQRGEDVGSDLWTTFNVTQEHLVRGGDRGRSGSGRRTRTRAVTGISQNVQLNRALWTLADEMAKLKLAA